tara:strand:- start:221 stop:616 length:396 start_codon:yes stop_codon:yes gene_type:complete
MWRRMIDELSQQSQRTAVHIPQHKIVEIVGPYTRKVSSKRTPIDCGGGASAPFVVAMNATSALHIGQRTTTREGDSTCNQYVSKQSAQKLCPHCVVMFVADLSAERQIGHSSGAIPGRDSGERPRTWSRCL